MRVKIMGLKEYTAKGRRYRYWRRKGAPQVRLDPKLKGAALAAKIAELEAKYIKKEALPGTLGQLIHQYQRKSHHWERLKPRTRKDYGKVIKWLGASRDCAIVSFTPPEVAAIRDKARDAHGVKFANRTITVFKKVFAFGIEAGLATENPALHTQKLHGGLKRASRPVTHQEAIDALDGAPRQLRPAIALLMYTGLRVGDVANLRKSAIQGDWLVHKQNKNGKEVRLFICDDLRWELDGIGKNDATHIAVKLDGTPWALSGLQTMLGRYFQSGVSSHGFRHTVADILAEADFDEWQVAHQLGHTPKTVTGRHYISSERRDLMKKMALCIEDAYRSARGNVTQIGTFAQRKLSNGGGSGV